MIRPVGPKAVDGHLTEGRLVIERDDGTTDSPPIWMSPGSIVDNGDFTCTLTVP